MSGSRPSSADEKATIVETRHSHRFSFFKKSDKDHKDPEKSEEPTSDEVQVEEFSPVAFLELFRFLTKREIVINVIGIIAAAAAGAAQPLMALLFGNLTQDFVAFQTILNDPARQDDIPAAADAFRHNAALNASYLTYIGVGMLACTYTYMSGWVYTGEVNAKRLREHYLRAVLRQDVAYFDKVGAGEVATRIQTDTRASHPARSWRLALAMSSILPCIAITGAAMNKFVSKYMQLSLKYVAEAGSIAEEVISTVRTAQAFGTQAILSSLYDTFINDSLQVDMKAAIWHGFGMGTFFFVVYSAYALAFSFGTTLINHGWANAGEVINGVMSILIGSFSLALLAPEMQAISHARGAAAKLYATIDRVPDIDSANPDGLQLENVYGEISLEDIKFHYPSRPNVPIVKGLNLTFKAGKTAALVGASGSGKSTIISLIERFYDPTEGTVKLDGVDLKELNLKWLRSQIGLVSQEPTLFATTIAGNVAHGLIGTRHEHASEEQKFALIKEACVKANADSFISKLPNGYQTMVGERGFLLSGGQKQRVAIARAIVSDPRILLLDEATSALDTQSEGIVQDALDKAAAGRTTITIAHRLSTIKDADVIYVMGEGLVLESGSHHELLDAEGAYAALVQAQKLREAKETVTDQAEDAESAKDLDKAIREEVPLGRKNTGRSLASELVEQKRIVAEANEVKVSYSLFYLFKRMGFIMKDHWHKYLVGSIAACASGMVYPAFGIVFAKGINSFSQIDSHERRFQGDRNALWLFLIAIISIVIVSAQNYYFASTAAALTARLRKLSFRAILRQDIEFFDKDENSTGALTSSLSNDPQKINGLAGITLGAIIQAIATVVSGSILGLVFIWKLGLVAMACLPLILSTGYIRLQVVVLKDQKNKKAHEESAQMACEAAGAIRTVASLTREEDCLKLYSSSLELPLKRSMHNAVWSNLLYSFSQATTFFVVSLVFWFGSRLVANQESSTFQFFVGLMSATFGAAQAGSVFSFVPDISSAKSAATDVLKLLDSVPEIDAESSEGKILSDKAVQGHVKFENVHFRYPTRPGVRVLRDLTLEVEPGTYVALVGASGCGKSTTIQLIERFYDPLAGSVLLDGENITEFNIQSYRKHIALVSQEPTLYAGTIRFNVLLGAVKPAEEVTQEEIENACRDANILEFIKSLPDGFETEVGGKGSQLSGGQKQRIAIARALLRNPKVLLLDEATSALDSNSEKVVQAALDQAAKGRTTIAIAHRLSTIQNADRIYFIKEGCVSESGTHDQLLAKRGDYYEYVQMQALSRNE
ncbi:hypothetical protein Ac2012v2_005499 [Leucoagaricus gongylophorus]